MRSVSQRKTTFTVARQIFFKGSWRVMNYCSYLFRFTHPIRTKSSGCYAFPCAVTYSAFRNFFPNFCLILKNRFLVQLSSNFQERLFMPFSSPKFFFGGVIFKITAEFRFFSPFPWKRSIYNSFSQTSFDYNTLVSRSIFLKFSGKTPDAIFLPQFSFRVVIFSLKPEFRFLCTFSRST